MVCCWGQAVRSRAPAKITVVKPNLFAKCIRVSFSIEFYFPGERRIKTVTRLEEKESCGDFRDAITRKTVFHANA
jgi:hypothetical protein